MKKEAIFIGKFNPPHIGHAFTILKLKKKYNLSIVVTNDIPENAIYTQDEIIEEMKEFGLPVLKFNGILTEQSINPFDKLILSGNEKVIEWGERVGANCKFVQRSGNIQATNMRK